MGGDTKDADEKAGMLKRAVAYAAPFISVYVVGQLKDIAASKVAEEAKRPLEALLGNHGIEHHYRGTNTRGYVLIGGKHEVPSTPSTALVLRGIPPEQFTKAAERLNLGVVARTILRFAQKRNIALVCEVGVDGLSGYDAGQPFTGHYPLERTRIRQIGIVSVDGQQYGSLKIAPGTAELPLWCNYKVESGIVHVKGIPIEVYPVPEFLRKKA